MTALGVTQTAVDPKQTKPSERSQRLPAGTGRPSWTHTSRPHHGGQRTRRTGRNEPARKAAAGPDGGSSGYFVSIHRPLSIRIITRARCRGRLCSCGPMDEHAVRADDVARLERVAPAPRKFLRTRPALLERFGTAFASSR